MLHLLALYGNKKAAVITTVSEEFNCSKKSVHRDLKNILQWYPKYIINDALYPIIQTQLEILKRQIWELIAQDNDKNPTVKIDAINTSLKITQEQTKLGETLGAITRKPVEVTQTRTVTLPFEALPEIKEAYAKLAAQAKAEKDAKTKDAKAKDADEEGV